MVSNDELILRVITLWFLVLSQFLGMLWVPLKEALNKNTRDNSSTDLSPDDFSDYFSTIGTKIAETINDAKVDHASSNLFTSFIINFTFFRNYRNVNS